MRLLVGAFAIGVAMALAGCLSEVEEAASVLSGEEEAYLSEVDHITADWETHRQKLVEAADAYAYGGATKGETLRAMSEVHQALESDLEELAALMPPLAWGKSHYHLVQAYDAYVRGLESQMDCLRYDDLYACDLAADLAETGNTHIDRSVELAPY